MNPIEFEGNFNSLLEYDWFTSMERIFHVTSCNEEEKVTFTTHMLKGPTIKWWTSLSSCMATQGILKHWEHFKEVFFDKYFPDSLKAKKKLEFQQLSQGNMLVADFT